MDKLALVIGEDYRMTSRQIDEPFLVEYCAVRLR